MTGEDVAAGLATAIAQSAKMRLPDGWRRFYLFQYWMDIAIELARRIAYDWHSR